LLQIRIAYGATLALQTMKILVTMGRLWRGVRGVCFKYDERRESIMVWLVALACLQRAMHLPLRTMPWLVRLSPQVAEC